jgi:ribose transport system permease protein
MMCYGRLSIAEFVLAAWLLICIAVPLFNGSLSASLVQVWLANALPYFMLSLAAALIISCGQIDISTGGIVSLAGMIIVAAFTASGGTTTGVLISHGLALIAVLLIYLAYAFAARRGISTLIVTLSLLLVAKGSSTLLQSCLHGVGEICRTGRIMTGGSAILPEWAVLNIVGDAWFSVLAFVLVLSGAQMWRHRTRWGLEHIAVGMDVEASKFCRIPVRTIYTRAFLAAGVLVFVATVMRLHGPNDGGWSANTGWGDELLAIAIAVIGGTRISGGRFNPTWILVASLTVYISRDIITSDLGIPAEVASLVFGALLLSIVAVEMSRKSSWGSGRG